MEYNHAQAVADGVNVDFDVYKNHTRITVGGSTVEAGPLEQIGRRDRLTRKMRWEQLDEDLTYPASELDRAVVAEDQIRTIIRTFRERLFTDIFPGRTEVPKTLIYAKDDSHAEDIVNIVREEFGKGNDFCAKITYRTGTARIVTKVTDEHGQEVERIEYKSRGLKPEDLLSSFRNSFNPRIAVTVDMIATGTDIKPLEIVMFMRAVQSRNFFEQMKGRGVRVINSTDLQGATPDAKAKDHFVIVDCVGITDHKLSDTYPLDHKKTVTLEELLEQIALGNREPDVLSSIAGRFARMDRSIGPDERRVIEEASGGSRCTTSLSEWRRTLSWGRGNRIVTRALFLLLMFTGVAHAQNTAGDEIRNVVKPGQRLAVTDQGGREIKGRVWMSVAMRSRFNRKDSTTTCATPTSSGSIAWRRCEMEL